MMDKQINLFRNVFKDEQERRRRLALVAFAACLLALGAWGLADQASRSERAAQAELDRVEDALRIEQGLIEALGKAQKGAIKAPGPAMSAGRAAELDLLDKVNDGSLWSSLDGMLRNWRFAGTRFKRVVLDKGFLTVSGEARTQYQAREALEEISAGLSEHATLGASKMEMKSSDSSVGFTWTGAIASKEAR